MDLSNSFYFCVFWQMPSKFNDYDAVIGKKDYKGFLYPKVILYFNY